MINIPDMSLAIQTESVCILQKYLCSSENDKYKSFHIVNSRKTWSKISSYGRIQCTIIRFSTRTSSNCVTFRNANCNIYLETHIALKNSYFSDLLLFDASLLINSKHTVHAKKLLIHSRKC